MKPEDRAIQNPVERLGDMRAEILVTAIRDLDGVTVIG
jgi:hypothetical protein